MGNLGLVLNIAKDALYAQQYCIDVAGHNIANVNTEGYSRQTPVLGAIEGAPYGGHIIGRGAQIEEVIRKCDNFIEARLQEQKTDLMALNEKELYLNVLETIFNEHSDQSLSTQFTDFWNSWNDLANDPSGFSGRNILYETGSTLALAFNDRYRDMSLFEREIGFSLDTGTDKINQLTAQIAALNELISNTETKFAPNDLLDQRNILLGQLSEYIAIDCFSVDNGNLTVITDGGYTLVDRAYSYDLKFENTEIKWEASGGSWKTITDYINGGKMGGWLDIRDEVIPKYREDLDVLSKEMIWEINQQHSQGVGTELFDSSLTGTYSTDSSTLLSTLTYGNKIDYTKDFKMWTYDSGATSPVPVDIDMAISSADPDYTHANTDFLVGSTTYTIEVTQGGTVGVGGDEIQFEWSETTGATSGTATLAADATIAVFDDGTTKLEFSAGDLIAGNTLKINTIADTSPAPVLMTPTGTANSVLDTYTFTVASGSGGTIGTDTINIGWTNSITSGSFTLDAVPTPVTVDGMTLTFASGYMFAGDVFTIAADANGAPTADLLPDWHWSLDSFISQFNRQTSRVTASNTDNALVFTPYTTGTDKEINDIVYSGGVTAANATVTVNNCAALTADTGGTPFRLTWDGVGWTIGNPAYLNAAVLSGDADSVQIDMDDTDGNGSADITVDFSSALTAAGYVEFDIAAANGTYGFAFSDDEAQDSGLMAALGINTFFTGNDANTMGMNSILNTNKGLIAAGCVDASTADFAVGDNTNALNIANQQYEGLTSIKTWVYDRGSSPTSSGLSNTSLDNYLHFFVGSLGFLSHTTQSSQKYNEIIVNQLAETRNNISAVSLDEEMTNLIKYQHAYSAAAKLISTADEMLRELLSVK